MRLKQWIIVGIVLLGLTSGTVSAQDYRPLEGQALTNVVAFTRLAGYVRYFHPSDQAAAADWDQFMIDGMAAVEGATGPDELIAILNELFAPIAPTVQIYATDGPIPTPYQPPDTDNLTLIAWYHYGIQGEPQRLYHSERVTKRPDGPPPPEMPNFPTDPYVADLGGGVTCRVPLVIYTDSEGTLPHLPIPAHAAEAGPPDLIMMQRAERLAAVAAGWNVFQHFYPYFDVVDVEWPAVLETALQCAATDSDGYALLDTLRWMVVQLQDGHGRVYLSDQISSAFLPLMFDWIEQQVVITAVDPAVPVDLRPGDVVLGVDGQPIDDLLKQWDQQIFGSTERGRRYMALFQLFSPGWTSVDLAIRHPDGTPAEVTVPRIDYSKLQPEDWLTPQRPEKIVMLEPGVYYLDLTRITYIDYLGIRPDLVNAQAVIFDMRGYPLEDGYRAKILPDLTDARCPLLLYQVPQPSAPDQSHLTYQDYQIELDGSTHPTFAGQIIFLTDERAMSQAEDLLAVVVNCNIGSIVGSQTYGVDGDVNITALPGGYQMMWTGMRVTWPDGTQFHNKGITPTVWAEPTLQGIAAGRDEVLEAALDLIHTP